MLHIFIDNIRERTPFSICALVRFLMMKLKW